MPNTLCHILLQTPLHRAFFSNRGLLWVIIACIIPDIPWILLRGALALEVADPYALRLYTSIQASLFFCLVLSAALAQCSPRPAGIFLLLAANCLLHLLIDATQVKWANGVHLLAPFDWSSLQLHIFGPEHPLGVLMTVSGCIYLLWLWPKIAGQQASPPAFRATGMAVAAVCLVVYLAGPLLFLEKLAQGDFYYLQTLRERKFRPGKHIEFDRVPYSASRRTVTLFSGESVTLRGKLPASSGTLSVQGRFITPDTVQVSRYRRHGRIRDPASVLGIFLICSLTAQTLLLSHFPLRRFQKGPQP